MTKQLSQKTGLLLLLLLSIFSSCNEAGSQNADTADSTLPTRRELYNAIRDAGKIFFVYPSDNKAIAEQYRGLMNNIELPNRMQLTVEVASDTILTEDFLRQHPVFLFGDFRQNPFWQRLSSKFPFTQREKSISLGDTQFGSDQHVLKLMMYPNPLNQRLPISVITGTSNEVVYKFVKEQLAENWGGLFWSSWGYEVYDGNNIQMMGYFSEETWKMDKSVHFEFSSDKDTLIRSKHFSFIAQEKEQFLDEVPDLAKACEANLQRMLDFLEIDTLDFHLDYQIHSSMELKGLQLNNTDMMQLEPNSRKIHVIWNDYMKGILQQGENLALVKHLFGEAKIPALRDGLALQFADQWHEKGIHYWAGLLWNSGNLPPISDLVNTDLYEKESPLAMQPAAVQLVAFLIEKYGKETFLNKLYGNWQLSKVEANHLQKEWEQFLEKRFENWKKLDRTINKKNFYKGFNFAHEGYRIYNGYGSSLAKASIEKLGSLGTNAIAIIPYSYMRNPNKPSFFNLEHSARSENDESVIFANAQAKQQGMYTLMKPQIWMGRSWPGDVMMESESDWDQWFEYYHRWIRHYALLAEMYEFDGLSLGVEFAKATIAQPERWRKLARRIRPLFNGDLTYCANWGSEFEKFQLWEEFDYIGLNCYYPLSKNEQVEKSVLAENFAQIIKKIEKVIDETNKPLVFTEIGFRSVEQTWINPHEDANRRPVNEEAQAICYEVVFEGIEGKDWCKGIMWWKWPSYLYYEGQQNTSFTPNRKLAEKVVQKWFSK